MLHQPTGFGTAAAIGLVLAWTTPATALVQAPQLCPTAGAEQGQVTSVDSHLVMHLADGRALRLVGIERPDDQPAGEVQLAAFSKLAAMMSGAPVTFTALRAPDRWGEIPAFVFADGPAQQPDQSPPATASVNALLIAQGLARVGVTVDARPCFQSYLAVEAGARAAGLGLWAEPAKRILAASDTRALREQAGRMVVVEGILLHIGEAGRRTYLNFGPRRGADFSVTIGKQTRDALEKGSKAGAPSEMAPRLLAAGLPSLVGQRLRVRGLMDVQFGPQIELFDADQIELVDASAGVDR